MQYNVHMGISKVKSSWRKYAAGLSAIAVAGAFALTGLGASAASASNPLLCFAGPTDGGPQYNGTCTLSSDGNSALVNTVDGDLDPNNAYAGVYYATTSLSGVLVGQVDKLSFTFSGTNASGGSPRITLPIDKNGDGITESFISIDTLGCSNGTPNSGTVNVIGNPTCVVSDNATGESFPNYAAFVAAHSNYRVATDAIPFVVVDQPGTFTISNVQIGSGAVVSKKEQCKNGGYKTMTDASGKPYKNQGQCVSDAVSSPNSKSHR